MKDMTIAQHWDQLHGEKTSIITRWENYAEWTLPYICSRDSSTKPDQELQNTLESIGARAVNHLSNRMVMILFQPHSPFFRLSVDKEKLSELMAAATNDDAEAIELLNMIDQQLADAEQQAMVQIDAASYRSQATMACKYLIITGNTLIYDPPGTDKAQVYGPKDYCIKRDLAGNVVRGITRDQAAFSTFSPQVQEALRTRKTKNTYEDDTNVKLYTAFHWDGDRQLWVVKQAADEVDLELDEVTYPEDAFPWIDLTWNLKRGDNYGRGLVEDYSGSFHAINVLTRALVEAAATTADIKWLVDPSSLLDVEELNKSPSGSYHQGRKDDISAVQADKLKDIQMVQSFIERLERNIGHAFLLNSSIQRDAERVTAEEIRIMASELETANGGVYSHLASTWQMRQAKLLMVDLEIDVAGDLVFPKIVTGMDSLSRNGDLENIRLFMADLAMLREIPEEFRAVISRERFLQTIGTARGIDYKKFLMTPSEIQAEQDRQMAQQQQMLEAQSAAKGGEGVAKELAKQE